MGKMAAIANKFKSYMTPVIWVKNDGKTFIVGSTLRRTPNTLVNDWDLVGVEVRGGPVEMVGPKGWRGSEQKGVGYLCDETGITLEIKRNGPELTERNSAENADMVFKTFESVTYKLSAEQVPIILISNGGNTWTWGEMIRRRGKTLTNGPGQPAYKIVSPAVEITNMASGYTGMGYLCDETGITVDFKRDIIILAPPPLVTIEGLKLTPVEIFGNFSGAIGKLATFDKIPEIFNIGQSKRNLYMGILIGGIFGLLLGLIL
jgi:hypothetical protein